MTTPDALLAQRRIVGIDVARFAAILGMMAGVLAIGAVLTLLHRRGPLEALLGWLSGSSRRRTPQVSPAAV